MFNRQQTLTALGHRFHANVSDFAIVHKVPQIPVMIDDHECDPRTVKELDGLPLHTMIDQDAIDGKMLKIFSSPLVASDFVRSGNLTVSDTEERISSSVHFQAPPAPPPSPSTFNGFVELYEHIERYGLEWRFIVPSVSDFTKEWGGGFLWWGWVNLNDVTSSLAAQILPPVKELVLCEHIHFGGSWLHFPPKVYVESLVTFGWNDRASSYKTHT